MAQQSLFGEMIPDRKTFTKVTLDKKGEPQVNDEEDYDETETDVEPTGEDEDGTIDTGLIEIDAVEDGPWCSQCKKAKESLAYQRFDYVGDLQSEGLRGSTTLERNWRGAEESYGGMWGSGGSWSTPEEVKALREELVEWYTDWMNVPYCREKANEFTLRGIKRENIRLLFSEKAKEFVQRVGGWSVDELQAELNTIPEAELTPEYMAKCNEYEQCQEDETKYSRLANSLRSDIEKGLAGKNLLITPDMIKVKYEQLQDATIRSENARRRWDELRNELGHYI